MAHVGVMHGIDLGCEGLRVRYPELHFRIGIRKGVRQDANDCVRRRIEVNLFADYRSIPGEASLKEAPGEHGDVVCFGLIFLRGEPAAQNRLNAKD